MSSAEESTVLVVPVECAQKIRFELEKLQLWDATHKLQKLADSDQLAIPVKINGENISLITDKWPDLRVSRTCLPISKKVKVKQSNPAVRLQNEICQLLTLYGMSEELLLEVPSKWERHDDLVIIPAHTLTSPEWAAIGDHLWEVVAKCLTCKRLARHSSIANNGFRSSRVIMLLGQNGEVTHVDNAIRYTYDVTRCMFSPGNITEKLRVANLDCTNETVVDLYAGIGYFTLPYLVHAKACHVHACEWNPDAVVALKHNLLVNGVAERCTVHEGDNRKLQLPPLADRVNLGLIPSSEEGWPVAVQVLKLSGGILHIHHNVTTFHHRGASGDETEDLHYEFQQIDAKNESSERCGWQLHGSQQKGEENVLKTGSENGNLSCCFLEGKAMNSALVDQDVKDSVKASECTFLENCCNFRENSGKLDHSDTNLCAVDDDTAEPEDCSVYLPRESLQHTSQRWQQSSSDSLSSQCNELKNVVSECRTNIYSNISRKACNMRSEDSCQTGLFTCSDFTEDDGLDQTSQKRTGKNVLAACEQWSVSVQRQIKSLLETKKGGTWRVAMLHLEIVKSYAPHIFHVVLDLECRPA